jgi:hypothetical protein
MTDDSDPFYQPGRPQARRQPQPGDRIWTLRKAVARYDCELRFHGERYGWEAQLLRDGDIRLCRGGFVTRALALQWADLERKALQAEGWRAV